jgi:hypothetical protein
MGRGWRERSLEYTKPSLSAKEWQGSKCLLEQAGESQFARVNFSPDMKKHTGRLRGRHVILRRAPVQRSAPKYALDGEW